jgi:peptidyl-prolyl cis-trans isomerase SurA
MQKICLSLLSLFLVVLPAWAADQVIEEIVARVNNQIITRSEYVRSQEELKKEAQQQDPVDADKIVADRDKDVLRDLIDQQLLLQKGKELGITADTELIKKLDQIWKKRRRRKGFPSRISSRTCATRSSPSR